MMMTDIGKFMDEHGADNWRKDLESLGVTVKEEHGYYIAKYNAVYDKVPPQFDKEIVKICRGIIFDKHGVVVCRPFKKFFNYDEEWADKIDWATAKASQKIDGSLIKLWYDIYREEWQFSTNGMVYAEDAKCATGGNFLELIEDCPQYLVLKRAIEQNKLDDGFTYVFELVHPKNVIVIEYPKPELFYLTAFNNFTGQENSKKDIYEWRSLAGEAEEVGQKEAAERVAAMNKDEVTEEGIVVCDKYGHRVKIKSEEYFIKHRLATVGYNFNDFVEDIKLGAVPKKSKDKGLYYKWLSKIYEACSVMESYAAQAEMFYLEKDGDRKITANYIKENISESLYRGFVFSYLDHKRKNQEVEVEELSFQYIASLPKSKLKKICSDEN